MEFTLGELARETDCRVIGDPEHVITRVATLQNAEAGSVAFLSNPAYRAFLRSTGATAVIVSETDAKDCPVAALVSENPYLTYARVAALLNPPRPVEPGIHPTAVVAESAAVASSAWVGPQCVVEPGAQIGADSYIGPGCVIGRNAVVGSGSRLVARATVCEISVIGQNTIIHPGAIVGSDGFGIANDEGEWVKVPQIGRVLIGDNVEVGANTTIDRGSVEDTVIEEGVKLDNQIQIAHNVRIGAHTAIAGCVGIAGSAKIGKHCAIGGGVGIVGHISIVDHVQITGMSFVTKSIKKPGVYSSGTPLQSNDDWRRNFARLRSLDEMARRLHALEKKLNLK